MSDMNSSSNNLLSQNRDVTSEIPQELWVNIATHEVLEPCDVASLQLTCQFLRHALYQKTIWINVLRSMCRKKGVLYASFPVEEMSLPQVQRAATAPYNFGQLSREKSWEIGHPNGVLNPLKAASKRKVSVSSPALHTDNDARSMSLRVFIVPGGRFMVTSNRRTGILSVWDLGRHGQKDDIPRPLAEITLGVPYEINDDTDEEYIEGGSGFAPFMLSSCVLRLAVTTATRSAQRISIHILDVDFSCQTTGVQLVRKRPPLALEGIREQRLETKHLLIPNADAFLFRSDDNAPYIVCNHREGWYTLGPVTGDARAETTMYASDALITYDSKRMKIWDILPLFIDPEQRLLCSQDAPHVKMPPPHSWLGVYRPAFSHREGISGWDRICGPSPWYSTNTHFESPLIVHHAPRNHREVSQYSLHIRRDSDDKLKAEYKHLATLPYPDDSIFRYLRNDPTRVGDSVPMDPTILASGPAVCLVTQTWKPGEPHWGIYTLNPNHDSRGLDSSLEEGSTAKHHGRVTMSTFEYPARRRDGKDAVFLGFCNWTGRLVYTGPSENEGASRNDLYLYVVDFLPF